MMWEAEWEQIDGPATLKGGQATVSKVRRRFDGTLGALKLLHSEHLGRTERRYRMQQEANALVALNGQGVPRLLASNVIRWTENGIPLFIVMEWIDGPTLAAACSKGPIDLNEALKIADKILDTITLCHGLDIHHRDLKPDNVILRDGASDAPVLVDFGMTWTRPNDELGIRLETPLGQELGNRFLRLPEYAPGQNSHDPRSDISMAVGLLFFMLSGRAPRQPHDGDGRMPHEVNEAHIPEKVRQDVRWPRLRRVFNVGFQPALDLRFQTVQALKERLINLTPPPDGNVQQELEEELAMISDVLNSAEARSADASKAKIKEALDRFLRGVQKAVEGTQFVFGGSGPNLVQGGRAGHMRFFMLQRGTSEPQASFHHLITTEGGVFKASMQVESGAPRIFYTGPMADPDSLYEAVEAEAPAVARSLLQVIRVKLSDQLRSS